MAKHNIGKYSEHQALQKRRETILLLSKEPQPRSNIDISNDNLTKLLKGKKIIELEFKTAQGEKLYQLGNVNKFGIFKLKLLTKSSHLKQTIKTSSKIIKLLTSK